MLKSLHEPRGDAATTDGDRDRPPPATGPRTSVTLARAIVQAALMLAILAGSYVVMNRLIAAAPERTARPQFEVSLPVAATTVALADQRPTVRLYGEVASARAIDIRPAVSGEVTEVHPDLSAGQSVAQGEVLFAIDPFDLEVALAEARANLAQTEATIAENRARLASERAQRDIAEQQLALARTDLERARQLSENGTLTAKQVEDRELIVSQREQAVSQRVNNIAIEQARLAQQSAVRDRQQLGVQRARRNLEDSRVRAPFSGVVRSSTVEVGRIVAANDVAVALYDDTALDVRFTLTDSQYGRIATDTDPLIGRQVDIVWTVGGVDYDYTGTVTRIGADIAADRGGVDVFARLAPSDAPVQLRPGAFVEVAVPDRLYRNAARVPETALYGTDTVYVIADGALHSREVTLGAFDGADAIISHGLVDGERVLTTRLSNVEDGLKVTVPGQAPPEGDGPVAGGGRPAADGEEG
ncbi:MULTISPECIES: efflux RND transporter periplasmic adaptor subunit [unclassified Roseitalea]|uniref:efflux RND transporter periplasmic adaptor subunit n=1 Tax=unclassified Roseitalea TaxID=2639107 RepID=UPI00273D39E7|nr:MULTISPECIES: efflux RND transporter periplasmic adaptor subunit [unclassified Roseitalea]